MKEEKLCADIARLLELIRDTSILLSQLKEAGKDEKSLAYRQEMHLRWQCAAELDSILNQYQLTVQPLETRNSSI